MQILLELVMPKHLNERLDRFFNVNQRIARKEKKNVFCLIRDEVEGSDVRR